jgi:hypothetical protein
MTGGSAQRHGTLRPCEKSQATISLRSKGRFANYVRPMIPRLRALAAQSQSKR